MVGVVHVGCEIYTADNVQQLQTIVEKLKRDEREEKENPGKVEPVGIK